MLTRNIIGLGVIGIKFISKMYKDCNNGGVLSDGNYFRRISI